MPQDIHLDLELSVLEVVLLGRLDSLSLRLDDAMITAALTALDDIGLLHLAERSVNTLSGGQCQMVLFAQALMRRPQILMLDEPVSALDLYYQQVLLEHLKRQTRDHHWVSVMVVHDLNLAAQYADNLLVLKQGRLVAQGTPAAVLTPELIAEVYQVDADVVLDQNGVPFVRTHGIRGEQRTSATLAENVLRVA
jgi:iron complex transport system ATP-binding protein